MQENRYLNCKQSTMKVFRISIAHSVTIRREDILSKYYKKYTLRGGITSLSNWHASDILQFVTLKFGLGESKGRRIEKVYWVWLNYIIFNLIEAGKTIQSPRGEEPLEIYWRS